MRRQCLWLNGPYQVHVCDEPIQEVGADQVLVQTILSAISAGTELLFYRGQVPLGMPVDATIAELRRDMGYPLRYGYACVGCVIKVGAQVIDREAWRDRLVFSFHPHASHFIARPDDLLPVPNAVSPERAAFLPSMETAVNFVMDGAPLIGERVVLIGQGIVGLLTTALVARMPLALLATFDRFPLRRERSRAFGASDVFDPEDANALERARSLLLPNGADLTYELSGNPQALNLGIELTGSSGRIIIGSWYGEKRAPIDFGGPFHRSRIRILSSQVSTIAPELSRRWTKERRLDIAWTMLAQLPLSELITHRFPIGDAARAYALLDQQPDQALQVVLTY